MITLNNLIDVCDRLNKADVKYVVIGGCAIFLHGYERTTRDIDLLIEPSSENIAKLKKALEDLLPEAASELLPDDVMKNVVVRLVGEDIIIDLIHKVGDVGFEEVWQSRITEDLKGTMIPVADVDSMLRLKEGVREIDKKDYLFLKGKKEFLQKKKGK